MLVHVMVTTKLPHGVHSTAVCMPATIYVPPQATAHKLFGCGCFFLLIAVAPGYPELSTPNWTSTATLTFTHNHTPCVWFRRRTE